MNIDKKKKSFYIYVYPCSTMAFSRRFRFHAQEAAGAFNESEVLVVGKFAGVEIGAKADRAGIQVNVWLVMNGQADHERAILGASDGFLGVVAPANGGVAGINFFGGVRGLEMFVFHGIKPHAATPFAPFKGLFIDNDFGHVRTALWTIHESTPHEENIIIARGWGVGQQNSVVVMFVKRLR